MTNTTINGYERIDEGLWYRKATLGVYIAEQPYPDNDQEVFIALPDIDSLITALKIAQKAS